MTASFIRRVLFGFLFGGLVATAQAAAPTILVMGDSLSAAYGIPVDKGWVQLLQARLRSEGYPHRVVNGSITGETTAGGLARLPKALQQHEPEIVLIELGGNDGLRGLPLAEMRKNLTQLAALSRKAGAQPVLFEMRIPPNYGSAYADGFQKTFAAVAKEHNAPMVPFFLFALIDHPDTFQDDGIHPTAAAQTRMLEAVWATLRPLLKAESSKAAAP